MRVRQPGRTSQGAFPPPARREMWYRRDNWGNEVSGAAGPRLQVSSEEGRTPMGTTGGDRGPDRLDVYRVSYVIWTREDGENGRRKRELREELYAGRTADEAADGAVRRASEAYPPDSGWHLDGV